MANGPGDVAAIVLVFGLMFGISLAAIEMVSNQIERLINALYLRKMRRDKTKH